MQSVAQIPLDLITVLQALIVLFVAAPALVKAIFRLRDRARPPRLGHRRWRRAGSACHRDRRATVADGRRADRRGSGTGNAGSAPRSC